MPKRSVLRPHDLGPEVTDLVLGIFRYYRTVLIPPASSSKERDWLEQESIFQCRKLIAETISNNYVKYEIEKNFYRNGEDVVVGKVHLPFVFDEQIRSLEKNLYDEKLRNNEYKKNNARLKNELKRLTNLPWWRRLFKVSYGQADQIIDQSV